MQYTGFLEPFVAAANVLDMPRPNVPYVVNPLSLATHNAQRDP